MTALQSFSSVMTADGEYSFPPLEPGHAVAVTVVGVFDSATVTLGYVTLTPAHMAVSGTLADVNEDELTFPPLYDMGPTGYNNRREYSSTGENELIATPVYYLKALDPALNSGNYWVLLAYGTGELLGSYTSTADVDDPTEIPAGDWHADNNPTGWKPVGDATGTPAVAYTAAASAFIGYKDANGSALTATAATGWEVRLPISGRLAVSVASVAAAAQIRLSAAYCR
jgi:hypothetical protein